MPYLTYDEFKEIQGAEIDESTFDKLLPKATPILDYVTKHYYSYVDYENDNAFRVKQFKKALSAQIAYFHESGANTFAGLNKAPQSFSAGRTSVTNASGNTSEGNGKKSLIAEEVYMHLEGTGLLFAGVPSW
jgi:hypothetical protein